MVWCTSFSAYFPSRLLLLLWSLYCTIFPQRLVSSLSEGVAVCSPSSDSFRSSVASAAPAYPGPAFSAHTGYKHRWMPPWATGCCGQVQINDVCSCKHDATSSLLFNAHCHVYFSAAVRERSILLLLRWHGVMSQGCWRPCWGIWRPLWRVLMILFRRTTAWLWYQLTSFIYKLITTSSPNRCLCVTILWIPELKCKLFIDAKCFPQSCFKPVETLQELEHVTSEVLLPLMSHSGVKALIQNIR